MKTNLFAFLPSEIIIHILSRLPVRTIISCKCVCKSWLALLKMPYFVKAHLHNAVPGLAVHNCMASLYKLFEFEDGLDLENHNLHYRSVISLSLPFAGWVSGSDNGLLFLLGKDYGLCVCNPISRDYIMLNVIAPQELDHPFGPAFVSGFGVSKISCQYKVVCIFQDCICGQEVHPLFHGPNRECVCIVYTIGTGIWRQIPPIAYILYTRGNEGAFLNGNLHWLATYLNKIQLFISCLDLETEHFSTFTSPILLTDMMTVGLSNLQDFLCLCDNSTDKIEIWLMKEYGVKESWAKHYNICNDLAFHDAYSNYEIVYPIKVFNDGDILMAWDQNFLFYYSKKKRELDLY